MHWTFRFCLFYINFYVLPVAMIIIGLDKCNGMTRWSSRWLYNVCLVLYPSSRVKIFPRAFYSDKQGDGDYMTALVQTSSEDTSVSAENHQTMTAFPKNRNLVLYLYQIQNCCFLLNKFCQWTFHFHKIIEWN